MALKLRFFKWSLSRGEGREDAGAGSARQDGTYCCSQPDYYPRLCSGFESQYSLLHVQRLFLKCVDHSNKI